MQLDSWKLQSMCMPITVIPAFQPEKYGLCYVGVLLCINVVVRIVECTKLAMHNVLWIKKLDVRFINITRQSADNLFTL